MTCRTPGCLATIAVGLAVAAPAMAAPAGQDYEVRLERSECDGACPAYVVIVHGDGLVEYEGQRFVKELGRRTRRISPDDAHRLLAQFEQARFFGFEKRYQAGVTDEAAKTLTLRYGRMSHQVADNAGQAVGMSPVMIELELATDEAAGTDAWVGRQR